MNLNSDYDLRFFHLGLCIQEVYETGIKRIRHSDNALENLIIVFDLLSIVRSLGEYQVINNYVAFQEGIGFNRTIGRLLKQISYELKI